MISIDLEEALNMCLRADATLAAKSAFFAEVGLIGKSSIQRRIRTTKSSPDGEAWSPWAKGTAEQRQKRGTAGRGLLFDSGALLASVGVNQGPFGVEIFAGAKHAKFVDGGTKNMPARPFVGFGPDDKVRIAAALDAWVDRAWR